MKNAILSFWRDDTGATSIEYALIASIVSVSIILGLTSISGSLKSVFNKVGSNLTAAAGQ